MAVQPTIVSYVGDGTTTAYTFPFPYLKEDYVKVRVGGTDVAFTFTTTNSISLAAAPAAGTTLVISRETERESLVDFVDGSVLIEDDLDLSATQLLHIVQEAIDITGTTLALNADGSLAAGGRRITGMAAPVDDGDAVTKNWAETAGSSFVTQAAASAAAAAASAAAAAQGVDDLNLALTTVSPQLQADVFANDEFVTLKEHGAVGDNITTDTAAANAAIAALPADGGTIILSQGVNYLIDIPSLVLGGREVQWIGSGTINNTIYPNMPGQVELWSPANDRQVYYDGDAGPNEFVRYDYHRNAAYTGGVTGVSSVLRVFTSVGANAGDPNEVVSEWPFQARVDQYSDYVRAVALTGQSRRYGLGQTWAGHFNAIDYIDASTSSVNVWGFEANIQGDGDDPENRRIVGGFVAHNVALDFDTANPLQDIVGQGALIYPHSANYRYGLRFNTLDGAGVSKGKFIEAPIRMDVVSRDLMQLFNKETSGVLKAGTKLNTGTALQIIAAGNNAANQSAFYTEIRSLIQNNTTGAENGIMQFLTTSLGSRTTKMEIDASTSDPLRVMFSGTLKRVTEGSADSAGAGYRQLRVPN